MLEKRDYDYRSILQAHNLQGVVSLEESCNAQCVEDCFVGGANGIATLQDTYATCVLPNC